MLPSLALFSGVLLFLAGMLWARRMSRAEANRDDPCCILLNHPLLGAAVLDFEGLTVLRANPLFLGLTGFTEEELQAIRFPDLLDDADYAHHMMKACRRDGRFFAEMVPLRCRQGQYILLDLAARCCEFQNRAAVVVTVRNAANLQISEQLQARLAAIVCSAGMAVIGTDLDGRISEWNDAAEVIFACPRREILGKPFWELVAPGRIEQAMELALAVQRGKTLAGYESLAKRPDGTCFPVQLEAAAIRDTRGRVIGMSCILRDITREKESRKRLEMAQFALDHALDTIYWFNRDGQVIYANHAAQARSGFTLEQMRHMSPDQLDPRFTPQRFHQLWQTARAQGILHLEFEGTNKRQLEGLGRILNCEGEEYGCLFIRDITERKELEARLKAQAEAMRSANVQLEAASRAKSQFLANVSHELRTPLTSILGFSDLLASGDTALDLQETAATIRRNSQHLLELINDVLDLSKVESGQMRIDPRPVSLGALLRDVRHLMRGRARDKGLNLILRNHGPVPTQVVTDATRLKQVLINLLGNAIKFTESGTVAIQFRFIGNESVGRLVFEITDTGIGIDPDRFHQIFEPFNQVDASFTRKYGGTGLGLSISKRLVEMLGGRLKVTSQPGVGTTFAFDIETGPVAQGSMVEHLCDLLDDAEPRHDETRSSKPLLRGTRILLVEDGPDNQRFISLILQKAGAETVVAEHGAHGVESFKQHAEAGRPFDLVLMDMQMPVMDGFAATRQLRAIGYSGPIIALTAHAMSGEYARCTEAGCDGFATKPITKKDLLDLLLAYLGGQPDSPRALSAPHAETTAASSS